MEDIGTVKKIVLADNFLGNIDLVDVSLISEFARRKEGKLIRFALLTQCNNHICFISYIGVVFKASRFFN